MPDDQTPPRDDAAAQEVPAMLTGPLVEQSVTVPASRELVWQLLTTPAGLSSWYTIGGGAEVTAKVGSEMRLWWEADTVFFGRVVTVEAPRRFDYRLAQGVNVSLSMVPSTLVQFLVTEAPNDPAQTVVAVRESGFTELEDPKEVFTASTMAWIGALGLLQQSVTQLAEARRSSEG